MGGLECVAVIDVDGIEAYVVGHYTINTTPDEFDSYDIYVRNERSNVSELVDLGQAFDYQPSDEEVATIIKQIFNPSAVRLLAHA